MTPAASGAEAVAQSLAAFFAGRGYAPVEPPMLLPAEIVLDHMGEDIRRRLLIVSAPDGRELCLRPDFTLPLALWHIERGDAAGGRYSYAGYAFRFPLAADPLRRSAEFRQVGIEDYGAADPAHAEIETLRIALDALGEAGLADPALTFGDVSIFSALVDALDLNPGWAARLHRLFWRRQATGDIVAAMAGGPAAGEPADSVLGRALARLEPEEARAVIAEAMAIAGVGAAGGRGADEIAARFVEAAREERGLRPGPEIAALVERYLSLSVPAAEAAAALASFARDTGLGLDGCIESLARRLDLVAGSGVDLAHARFSTAFGRRIEYYTGFVFEARSRADENLGPIASGGRYDRFLADLGATAPLPAVGCSVYVDRLAAAVRSAR